MVSVLIADDSSSIRLVLKDILSIGKYKIIGEAVDGDDTVIKYSKLNPDLLLLDLAMPKKDGLQVIKEIIASDHEAKIILITAADNPKVISSCLTEGAKTVISKPFDFDKVLKIISDIVKK